MRKDKLLIVTSKDDAHADYLIELCNNRGLGEKVIRLNTEDFLHNCSVIFDGKEFHVRIQDSGRKLESARVEAVWYRRPKEFDIPEDVNPDVKQFITSQGTVVLRGLYFCTHDSATWVNPLPAMHRSRNKVQQIPFASSCGLQIPKTIITNRYDEAMAFFNSMKKVCTKSLDEPNFQYEGQLFPILTRVVDITEIYDNREPFEACPVLLQEYIEKRFDLRVIVMGDDFFAVEIHSQGQDLARHDFRGVAPEFLPHKPHKLPEHVKESIFRFVRGQGLRFSALDFAVTEDNEYFFLENNPNGQWLWLERLTGLPMSESMLQLLLSGKDKAT